MFFLGSAQHCTHFWLLNYKKSMFFCPGKCVLNGGLVVVMATYFMMLKVKRFSQIQTRQFDTIIEFIFSRWRNSPRTPLIVCVTI